MERLGLVDLPLLLENGLAPPALLFDQVILSDYGLVELARPSPWRPTK